ncbi:MAG: PorT family protein [Flavobacteriales bacterium]|nr:PorT family protein [Flavobacteriales bacterium]
MRKSVLCIILTLTGLCGRAQDNENVQVLTAGVEFRPIFPIDFLKTGDQLVSNNDFSISVSPKFSFSAGMIIRYGFHKRFALETGLNFVQRNYNLDIHRDSTAGKPEYKSKTDFTIIGYEHPIKLLVFVQLSEHIFMNAAAGFQLTFFPSDIFTSDENSSGSDQHFKHSSLRLGFDGKPGNDGFIHGGAIANLGFEYRTKKIGFFYLGGTYHVPFADVYSSKFAYADDSYASPAQEVRLNGSYLTFDVRYFFHSKPIAAKERKKKKKASKEDSSED